MTRTEGKAVAFRIRTICQRVGRAKTRCTCNCFHDHSDDCTMASAWDYYAGEFDDEMWELAESLNLCFQVAA